MICRRLGCTVEEMNVRETQTFLDENSHFIEQFIQIKYGGDVIADLSHHLQMFGPRLQLAIQAHTVNGNCDRIGQSPQDQQIIRVECPQTVRLHIQHAQDLAFNFQWQDSFGLCLRQQIEKPETRLSVNIIRDDLLTGLGD